MCYLLIIKEQNIHWQKTYSNIVNFIPFSVPNTDGFKTFYNAKVLTEFKGMLLPIFCIDINTHSGRK